jgi:hypothetical protein
MLVCLPCLLSAAAAVLFQYSDVEYWNNDSGAEFEEVFSDEQLAPDDDALEDDTLAADMPTRPDDRPPRRLLMGRGGC